MKRASVLTGAVGGAVLTAAVGLLIAPRIPAWNAERLFEQADSAHDDPGRCDGATRAAEAWASAGNYERAKEWRDKAGMPCSGTYIDDSRTH